MVNVDRFVCILEYLLSIHTILWYTSSKMIFRCNDSLDSLGIAIFIFEIYKVCHNGMAKSF